MKRFNSTKVASLPTISSTLILSRNPIITRDLPEFENQYYKYQNELWKRLMWTFPKWYYYREGTLADQRYKELNKPPVFNNPNLEFIEGRPDIKQLRDRRFKQVINLPKTYKTDDNGNEIIDEELQDNLSRKINPNPRTTKSDETNDLQSLERKLSKTLYLIIKDGNTWKLPNFKVTDNTPLNTLVEQGLYNIGGEEINYFNVSAKPCHVINNNNDNEFFIKSHILSGSFKSNNDFMWLTKQELNEYLPQDYYHQIEHLLN